LDKGSGAARLRPVDLVGLEAGLAVYFRQWFEDQQELNPGFDGTIVNDLLRVLSCALGPMKLAVLSSIVQSLSNKSLITKQSLRPIGRFVIGDGVDVGFAFTHPRLAAFVREEHFGGAKPIEEARWKIIEWCRSIVRSLNSRAILPGKVPDYALLYYVQHLEQLEPGLELMLYRELVEDGWRSAWLANDGGVQGFARDLQVVWTKLRQAASDKASALKEAKTGLGGLFRCALCICSIRSMGSAVPPNFMAELVRQNILSPKQALHLARMKPESDRPAALTALAPYLAQTSLDEALNDARALSPVHQRAATIASFAAATDEPRKGELFAEAFRIAERDPDEQTRKVLTERIERFRTPPAATNTQAPYSVADQVWDHPPVLYGGPKWPLPAPPDIDAAFETAIRESSHTPFDFSWKMQHLAPYLPDRLLARSLEIGLAGGSGADNFLCTVAPCLNSELLTRALDMTTAWHEALDDYYRARAFHILAPYLWKQARHRAMDTALFERQDHYGASYLKALLPFMGEEDLSAALDALNVWKDNRRFLDGFRVLLEHLTPPLIEKAFNIVSQQTRRNSGEALGHLLPLLPPDLFAKAVRRIPSLTTESRTAMLRAAVPPLSPTYLQAIIDAISGNMDDVETLLPFVPEPQRSAMVAAAYKSAFRVGDTIALGAALAAFTNRLREDEARRAATEVFHAMRNIGGDGDRAISSILMSFSRALSVQQRRTLFEDAMAFGRGQPLYKERAVLFACGLAL
jgi:hypothetical protein